MKLTSSKFPRGLIDLIPVLVIAMFCGRISQQTRYSCEHQLCSSSRRRISQQTRYSCEHQLCFSSRRRISQQTRYSCKHQLCSSSRRLLPLFERCIYHPGFFFKNNKKKLVRSFTFRYIDGWWVVVFNATFNNISVISRQSALLVEETEVPGENDRPVASF